VNEFKFGMNYFNSANIQQRAFKENIVGKLNLPGISQDPLLGGLPVFQVSGFANVGECNDCPFVNWNTTFQLSDNFSWTSGRHTFKFGGEYRRLRYNQIGAGTASTRANRWPICCLAICRTPKDRWARRWRASGRTTWRCT
jgi:hypothetical protein